MKSNRKINWVEMAEVKNEGKPSEKYHDPVAEFDYYQNLSDNISPINYMDPYIIDKVEIANNLYAELQNVKRDNISELVKIRRKSEQLLGIDYDPNIFYQYLLRSYSPENYLNPYNESKFRKAHKICSLLTESKDNYTILEDIWVSELEREQHERIRLEKEIKNKEERTDRIILYTSCIILIILTIFAYGISLYRSL